MRVAIFVTCLVDQLCPEVGISMVRLLRRLGCTVDFPRGQTCCGQPAFNAGHHDEARVVARSLIDVLGHADHVVTPSGSCAGMVHHGFAALFAGEDTAARVRHLAERTHELSSFIVNVLGREDLGATFRAKATYHPSCHATRILGVRDEPLRLLRQVRGLDLVPLPRAEDCCGFGGSFCVKLDAISAAMVEEKTANVAKTGADVLVGADLGCLLNMGGYLRRHGSRIEVLHLAQLLGRATTPAARTATGHS